MMSNEKRSAIKVGTQMFKKGSNRRPLYQEQKRALLVTLIYIPGRVDSIAVPLFTNSEYGDGNAFYGRDPLHCVQNY